MVSIADMEFKLAPKIYQKLMEFNGNRVHFGYPEAKKSTWEALRKWVRNRYVSKDI